MSNYEKELEARCEFLEKRLKTADDAIDELSSMLTRACMVISNDNTTSISNISPEFAVELGRDYAKRIVHLSIPEHYVISRIAQEIIFELHKEKMLTNLEKYIDE